ncbi:MAG: xanthine dehydrogenase molybdopterin binding subunit [Cellvibrionaceae bacterium]|nr:xanthine dehydrogenase molybdopterin binding subunit [Cellvibrionaceae bacterium]
MRKLPAAAPSPSSAAKQTGAALAHESAVKHVTGKAQYVDDMPEYPGQLHVATGQSAIACGTFTIVDLHGVRQAPGVVDVICYQDIPGNPDISPVFSGDLLLAKDRVSYVGQPIFAVAATSFRAAQQALQYAQIRYEESPPQLSTEQALLQQDFVLPTHRITRGDVHQALEAAPLRLRKKMYIRGQEHFYLEGQISTALATEDGGIHIHSSSQHPSEVQKLVASVLGIPLNLVSAEVRRMGGGFGGKESQAAALACMAAIFAQRSQRAVKYRMPRHDDMQQTGKRHDFLNQYDVGFDSEGSILAATMSLAGMCGCTADLSDGIVDRAMFHADNAYYFPAADISGYRCRTNTVSNTAFRGFGGPKSMITTEAVIDDIAWRLGKDPLEVRKRNVYQGDNNLSPYGQKIEQEVLPGLIDSLEKSAAYYPRRREINAFNRNNSLQRKGLSLTPVKFGISFTSKHLNQAGALVHIYTDGSILVNHGGTEMGQGLYTKIAQIVARALGVNVARVRVSAARTDKVANTSPTAASAGTDMNGMAALDAVNKIKSELLAFAARHYGVAASQIALRDDALHLAEQTLPFEEFIKTAYMNRVLLWSSGFYKVPKIGYDRARGEGRPFFYFANGAAVSEVLVDLLTGEYRVTRVDILHDVGQSLNPALDIGQIEGGFVQGMGWLTSEELLWDKKGRLISNSPANYKIPTASDVPEHFKVDLYPQPNNEETIYYSKAVGEPPLMLAISVWCALRDACASIGNYQFCPELAVPATPEKVFNAICQVQQFQAQNAPARPAPGASE